MARSQDGHGYYTHAFINAFRIVPRSPVTVTVTPRSAGSTKEYPMPREKLRLGQAITYTDEWYVTGDRPPIYYIAHIGKTSIIVLDAHSRLTIPRKVAARGKVLRQLSLLPDAKVLAERRPRDGYWHYALVLGRKVHIDAGCHDFFGIVAATKHWTGRRRNNNVYKGGTYGHWTGRSFPRKWVPFHTTPKAAAFRAKDRELNKWSLAFVRKVKRLRDRKAR